MLKQIAAGLGLALAASAPAFAGNAIVFDPDGTGAVAGDTTISSFDWFPGSAMTIGVIPTATGSFQTFAHGTLVGAGNQDGDPVGLAGLGSAYEITFVAAFGEGISAVTNTGYALQNNNGAPGGGDDVYTFTQSIVLGDPTGSQTNFFEVYWDDSIDASSVAGTGYNDGTLIASGAVTRVVGNFSTQFTFVDGDDDGVYNPAFDTIIGSGSPTGGFALLDQNGVDNWGGQQSVVGNGSTVIDVDLDPLTLNSDFFKTNIAALNMDVNFNTSNVLPFNETNPSQSYWDGSSQVAFGSGNVGEVNGLTGPDIIFQADANNSFVTDVPEPKTVLLFALGLLLLGATTARRRQAPQMTA
ncbi:MAG: PEP-CTERM sorting domain-containing protein [Halioglobus sp.]